MPCINSIWRLQQLSHFLMISSSKLQEDIKSELEKNPKTEYKYMEEWLKKVLNNECPDCEA